MKCPGTVSQIHSETAVYDSVEPPPKVGNDESRLAATLANDSCLNQISAKVKYSNLLKSN